MHSLGDKTCKSHMWHKKDFRTQCEKVKTGERRETILYFLDEEKVVRF